jgi:hypothetical protein
MCSDSPADVRESVSASDLKGTARLLDSSV